MCSIGEETAVKLANVLGSTAEFWLNREAQYRARLALIGTGRASEEWHCYVGMECAFRRTRESQSNVGAIAAGIRRGEILAEQLHCPKYSKSEISNWSFVRLSSIIKRC